MSAENVTLVRKALLGSASADAFYEVLDPEIEWDVTRAPGGEAVFRGRDAVRAFMQTWRHGWEYWRFEEEDFLDAGERVVTIARPGRAAVWTVRDEKVVRFVWYERGGAQRRRSRSSFIKVIPRGVTRSMRSTGATDSIDSRTCSRFTESWTATTWLALR
jgi:ketosteroid isomerase-like protein